MYVWNMQEIKLNLKQVEISWLVKWQKHRGLLTVLPLLSFSLFQIHLTNLLVCSKLSDLLAHYVFWLYVVFALPNWQEQVAATNPEFRENIMSKFATSICRISLIPSYKDDDAGVLQTLSHYYKSDRNSVTHQCSQLDVNTPCSCQKTKATSIPAIHSRWGNRDNTSKANRLTRSL